MYSYQCRYSRIEHVEAASCRNRGEHLSFFPGQGNPTPDGATLPDLSSRNDTSLISTMWSRARNGSGLRVDHIHVA